MSDYKQLEKLKKRELIALVIELEDKLMAFYQETLNDEKETTN